MRVRTTSTQRTYRYLRLSLVGVIVFLGIGVGAEIAANGPLPSVSSAYYTPARDVFVGALCAVALALLALSGRSIEQALLDLAALFAPVIALVPTPVLPGEIAGADIDCPLETSCVPTDLIPGIANGLTALAVVAGLGLAAALVLAWLQKTLTRGLAITVAVAAAVVATLTAWWMLSPQTFLLGAHGVAAVVFFALIAVVATIAAFRPADTVSVQRGGLRVAYGAIAIGIIAALVTVTAIVAGRALGGGRADAGVLPLFFAAEAAALLLFGAFWFVQTIELWNDEDPRALVTPTVPTRHSSAPTP